MKEITLILKSNTFFLKPDKMSDHFSIIVVIFAYKLDTFIVNYSDRHNIFENGY